MLKQSSTSGPGSRSTVLLCGSLDTTAAAKMEGTGLCGFEDGSECGLIDLRVFPEYSVSLCAFSKIQSVSITTDAPWHPLGV